jgi:hypothetical protein
MGFKDVVFGFCERNIRFKNYWIMGNPYKVFFI